MKAFDLVFRGPFTLPGYEIIVYGLERLWAPAGLIRYYGAEPYRVTSKQSLILFFEVQKTFGSPRKMTDLVPISGIHSAEGVCPCG
jgi:hypothetical protein